VFSYNFPQKIETVDNIRVIHNEKGGIWGSDPKVELRLVRTIGDIDVEDENLAFRSPNDIVLDSTGNMYILDAGNSRIQKLSPEGNFISSIGRKGQGPGEFNYPRSVEIDAKYNLYVFDAGNRRIQIFTSDGDVLKTIKFTQFSLNSIRLLKSSLLVMGGITDRRVLMDETKPLPKLFTVVDLGGNVETEFGEIRDYKDVNVNSTANWFNFDVDEAGNICLSFQRQNRIEKYTPDGKLLWKSDRILNYDTKVHDKGFIKRSDRGTSIQAPTMNQVSQGVSVDGKGRIWINTLNRQMSKEEMGMSISVGGVTKKVQEPKIQKMDIFKLEIFDSEGILLGEIPLDHLAHGIRIFDDILFIWDMQNTKYYQYEIIEK
jgi:sugar lactone lactonase YvrE